MARTRGTTGRQQTHAACRRFSSHEEWGTDHFGFTYKGDLRAFCEKLKKKGVRMAVKPWEFKPGLVLCYVAAPDGVSIELIQVNRPPILTTDDGVELQHQARR